jgi:hypothetical protein
MKIFYGHGCKENPNPDNDRQNKYKYSKKSSKSVQYN